MSGNGLFLIILSILVASTLTKERFFPERSQTVVQNSCSSSMKNLRNLQSDNEKRNRITQAKDIHGPDVTTVRLYGDTDLGYYYVNLYFGTPAQKQTLIVDTGSVTTTVPCIECGTNCGPNHFDKPFDQTQSSSFQKFECQESFGNYVCTDCIEKCRFSVGYVEGSSYSGHFNKDYVVFGNEIEDYFTRVKNAQTGNSNDSALAKEKEYVDKIIEKRRMLMPFGCTDRETKLFFTQEADGILGLGINTNSYGSPPNVLDTLQIINPVNTREFSLCLAQSGGYFTLGGHNTQYHEPNKEITYTDYNDNMGQYRVRLNKIEIEGEDIGLDSDTLNKGEGAFFDSGTTLTHVPGTTYNSLKQHLFDFCAKGNKNCGGDSSSKTTLCWKWNEADFPTLNEFLDSFPKYTWYFGDKNGKYEWNGHDYLYNKNENNYCMGLSRYERESILGGTFMKNHDVLFDKANKRLGFVRANCGAVNDITVPPQDDDTPVKPPPPKEPGQPTGGNPTVTNPTVLNTTKPTDVDNPMGPVQINVPPREPQDKNPAFKILIILAIIAGVLVIASIIVLAIKSYRRIRYSEMDMDIDAEAQHKDSKLPNPSDEVTHSNLDTEGENSQRYQV